jgi:hypothetical protein
MAELDGEPDDDFPRMPIPSSHYLSATD